MKTLTTDKKFTIIFSAYQANLSAFENMCNTAKLAAMLDNLIHVDYISAVGVYKEHAEQAFVVHTNCASRLTLIREACTNEFKQECILVRHNRTKEVVLRHESAKVSHIGHSFKLSKNPDMLKAISYTVLNGTDFYTVV